MVAQHKGQGNFQRIVAGYVRRSSLMQKDNYSIDAQERAMQEDCTKRGLPDPVFYEDDERSARSEQISQRPAFRRLIEDVEAGLVQVVMVHTLDRWSRNVMVTLQTFRLLAEKQTAFISITEHIDYSTPEGRLQLTILAAFAAYFSDMLSKHTTKGKGERAAGIYLLQKLGSARVTAHKSARDDLLDADLEAERILLTRLSNANSSLGILSEEAGRQGNED